MGRLASLSRGIDGIIKNGFAGLAMSHVNMKPFECPAAIAEWSADSANAKMEPHSAAVSLLVGQSSCGEGKSKNHTRGALSYNALQILLIVKDHDKSLGRPDDD